MSWRDRADCPEEDPELSPGPRSSRSRWPWSPASRKAFGVGTATTNGVPQPAGCLYSSCRPLCTRSLTGAEIPLRIQKGRSSQEQHRDHRPRRSTWRGAAVDEGGRAWLLSSIDSNRTKLCHRPPPSGTKPGPRPGAGVPFRQSQLDCPAQILDEVTKPSTTVRTTIVRMGVCPHPDRPVQPGGRLAALSARSDLSRGLGGSGRRLSTPLEGFFTGVDELLGLPA